MEHRILLELKNEDGCSVDSKGVKNKIRKINRVTTSNTTNGGCEYHLK